jgi:hypothetical protein
VASSACEERAAEEDSAVAAVQFLLDSKLIEQIVIGFVNSSGEDFLSKARLCEEQRRLESGSFA